MRIQVSEATALLLLQGKRFILSERGQVEVKVSVTVTTPHPPPSPPQLIESDLMLL